MLTWPFVCILELKIWWHSSNNNKLRFGGISQIIINCDFDGLIGNKKTMNFSWVYKDYWMVLVTKVYHYIYCCSLLALPLVSWRWWLRYFWFFLARFPCSCSDIWLICCAEQSRSPYIWRWTELEHGCLSLAKALVCLELV